MVDLSYTSFSDNLKRAISIAQSLSKEFSNEEISPAHFLKALLHKDVGLMDFLMKLDQDIYYLEEWAEVRIEMLPKSSNIDEVPQGDEQFQAVMREADNVRLKLSKDETDEYCALIALCTPGVGFNFEQLKTLTLSSQDILDSIMETSEIEKVIGISGDEKAKKGEKKGGSNALLKYCIDKNEQAQQGKLDPVVGRDNEIRRITEILGRRSKSNVLVLGDAGVGKTAWLYSKI